MIKLGIYKEIVWIDAAKHEDIDLANITEKPISEWTVERRTFGRLLKEDAHGVIVLVDIDEKQKCEIIAIPKRCILL